MVLICESAERLDKFLAQALPEHSRSKLATLVQQGLVTVDGRVRKPSFQLEPGMEVELDEPSDKAAHDLTPADIPLITVYEDEHMLVVDKPRGLAVHPAISLKEPSLVNALLARSHGLSAVGESFRPGIVHRIDKETTGLLMVAKTDAAHVSLARQIEEKTADRRYLAIVHGFPEQERFSIDAPIGRNTSDRQKMAVEPKGKWAVTHIKRLRRVDEGTLVAARLDTGRTHQIRVHLRAIGYPVIGDATYAPKELHGPPLQLHAAYIEFDHPATGQRVRCFAPPPADFFATATIDDLIEI